MSAYIKQRHPCGNFRRYTVRISAKTPTMLRSLVIFTVNQRKCKAVCNNRLSSLPYAMLKFTFIPLFSAITYKEVG